MSIRLAGVFAALTLAAHAQTLPTTEFETLAGGNLTLPAAAQGHAALLIAGFSHAASKPTTAWGKQLAPDCKAVGALCYNIAVLEAVPRFVRRMVIGGIRSGVAPEKRAQFLILLHDEDAWKKLCGFSDPDGAYLLLIARDGHIAWKFAGPPDAASLAEARKQLRARSRDVP